MKNIVFAWLLFSAFFGAAARADEAAADVAFCSSWGQVLRAVDAKLLDESSIEDVKGILDRECQGTKSLLECRTIIRSILDSYCGDTR